MTPLTGADLVLAAGVGSAGMTAAIWVLGPISVIAALGMITVRKAVHAALFLAVVMMSLAVLYAVQDAPFLAVVQVIVYTGAVLMLFLFVLMLVGVDSADSIVETIKGHRVLSWLVAVVFGIMVVVGFAQVVFHDAAGLEGANDQGNVTGIASLLFTRYVFAFEVTSALLITAVLGAMVLAHRERLEPKKSQREYLNERMQAYKTAGTHPGQRILPGTLAQHNSVMTPARLPDGSHVVMTVPGVLEGGDASPEAVQIEESEVTKVATRADEGNRAQRGGEPE
jgi:NADH-quinone oxidoreductase subunit J